MNSSIIIIRVLNQLFPFCSILPSAAFSHFTERCHFQRPFEFIYKDTLDRGFKKLFFLFYYNTFFLL